MQWWFDSCSAAQLALIDDLVGYGSANFYEAQPRRAYADQHRPALSVANGCTDTDNNGADFNAALHQLRATPPRRSTGAPPRQLPNLTINDVSVNEGNAGTTSFDFTVSLSSPAGAGGVTFDIATADGTATSPSDYTPNR